MAPIVPSVQTTVYSESGNYSNQLLRQGRGFAVYSPKPQRNLAPEYRKKGVSIGDVGTITPQGTFDYFFNIYLPADDPINAHIPDSFVPLPPYLVMDVIEEDFDPGDYVSSPSIHEINDGFSEPVPGGEFVFSCRGPNGAVLALPYGSHLEKLQSIAEMRRYARKHAESWYKHVNETRGRALVNGSLYLITGCEKAESWGIATFHDVPGPNEFQLSFAPTTDVDHGHRYRWHAPYCRQKHADSPAVVGTPLNQTTFIHAFAISLGETLWGTLFGDVEICQLADSSTFPEKSGRGFVPYGSQGFSFVWSFSEAVQPVEENSTLERRQHLKTLSYPMPLRFHR
ncbi:hypothetical protein DFH08DRAFT_682466 [Mycena albidolilacea]|uniref:Uncharacterized protein n=1 Tax=Mycena albidolilacea TaxID=1033008 RepID=A0AAD7F270_9AGAR|nr:hypothetical protein DFH08DRAFT_682466 [Mycena albidolilacea]